MTRKLVEAAVAAACLVAGAVAQVIHNVAQLL